MNSQSSLRWLAIPFGAACLLSAAGAVAQTGKVRIAVVTPLTGPLSVVNGPGQNAARMLADAINKGELPPPYNTGKGLGGKEVELVFLDENGGNAKQVAEFRALVGRQGADAVMGFGSAATCVANRTRGRGTESPDGQPSCASAAFGTKACIDSRGGAPISRGTAPRPCRPAVVPS
jgi:branched-chain amino acid transport system substrate-binding protein